MIRGWLQLSSSDTMIATAPEGTPPRRIGEQNSKQLPAPPCLAEALMRESIVWRRFSWSGYELPFISVSTESNNGYNPWIVLRFFASGISYLTPNTLPVSPYDLFGNLLIIAGIILLLIGSYQQKNSPAYENYQKYRVYFKKKISPCLQYGILF
jgi:hypothetical protein